VKGYDFSHPAIELARENISSTDLDIEVDHLPNIVNYPHRFVIGKIRRLYWVIYPAETVDCASTRGLPNFYLRF
jgi:hypothetical protein